MFTKSRDLYRTRRTTTYQIKTQIKSLKNLNKTTTEMFYKTGERERERERGRERERERELQLELENFIFQGL